MLRPIPHEVSRGLKAVLTGEASQEALVRALGPPTLRAADEQGRGPIDGWDLAAPCGLLLGLVRYERDRQGLVRHDRQGPVEVYASDLDAEHVAAHVCSFVGAISPHERDPEAPARFALLRQDDNGNRVEMRRFASRCAAEHERDVFEARGHKQVCWVEPLA
jgi:hypothetical protein